jgi:hypothetical protein
VTNPDCFDFQRLHCAIVPSVLIISIYNENNEWVQKHFTLFWRINNPLHYVPYVFNLNRLLIMSCALRRSIMRFPVIKSSSLFTIALLCMITALAACSPNPEFIKMNPPPDVDIQQPRIPGDNSCWMATASNMLAAAGYGNGYTVQERADDIYADMLDEWEVTQAGFVETAIQWWLGSTNNKWPDNPYTITESWYNYDNPITYDDAPMWFGNYLRSCYFAGISITWPTETGSIGGHAMAAWGDNAGNEDLTFVPGVIKLTNSHDEDENVPYFRYNYDSFSNPNPGGPNQGEGWYLDYSENHPYIKEFIFLESTDLPNDHVKTQMVTGSFMIIQTEKTAASDLHYDAFSDSEVLSYRTWTNWSDDISPTITETTYSPTEPSMSGNTLDGISVDWDFSDNRIPQGEKIIATTVFIEPNYNFILHTNIYFTYPDETEGGSGPFFFWRLYTPEIDNASQIPNVRGGYVVGSFDLVNPRRDNQVVAQYRFMHQFWFDQDPESHVFTMQGNQGLLVTNLRFGHSYGYLKGETLWDFEDWLTIIREPLPLGADEISIKLNWDGLLTYPDPGLFEDAALTYKDALSD